MKKTLFVFVLAAVLVLSFSTVAMAKYAGYAYNVGSGGNVGYLSWAGAKALMTANGVPANLQTSAHGNYTANTTKCAVCHSVHRAATDPGRTAAGVGSYYKLTPGAQACTACHTAWGANPIPSALIEWANPVDGAAGPHTHANTPNACLGSCHAGVHGGTMSVYGAVQAFNLTNRNDAAIGAALAAGNVRTGIVTAATMSGAYEPLSSVQKAATRAMATGYTCGASGCHSSSQFAVNANGYAEARAGDPSDPDTLATFMTGHSTALREHCGSAQGCHSVVGNLSDNNCAVCHDMIGKATNSTAFPHGNRNIVVYEYKRPAGVLTRTETTATAGNLWMYGGDVTWRDASGAPNSTIRWDGRTGSGITYGDDVGGFALTTINTRTVINNAAGFHGGQIGDIRDGVCLKCHGYKYWYGWNLTAVHANRSFANR